MHALCLPAALLMALAACDRRISPPDAIPELGIRIPPGASRFHAASDDQLRILTNYYRFDLEPGELHDLVSRLPCTLESADGNRLAAANVPGKVPDWYALDNGRTYRACEGTKLMQEGDHDDLWFFALTVDVSRPDRYTIYLGASL